jgi:uncharacterized protein (UPF0147 family)
MPASPLDRQRLSDLERLLELDYEKLSSFEEQLTITSNAPAKFEIRTLIRSEVLPNLRKHEHEYAELLAINARTERMSETEASALVDQTLKATEAIDNRVPENVRSEVNKLAAQLRQELEKPGVAASAKLKVSLPIIPLIASYELEVETGGLMVRAWRGVKGFFAGAVEGPR